MTILSFLENALAARTPLLEAPHQTALRLFNGFLEGWPNWVVELYADTLVLLNHANPPETLSPTPSEIADFYRQHLPWLNCAIVKNRIQIPSPLAPLPSEEGRDSKLPSPRGRGAGGEGDSRRGTLLFGQQPARQIREHGVRYALDLTLNQDTSFYIDTRNLRQWATENLAEKRVLNTFAYTGSLGVAAMAGRARQVIHIDLNRQFLNLAKTSYTLNGFPIQRADFRVGDFFPTVNALKREGTLFDCIFLDPPFFSATARGRVDLVNEATRLINKVRPLIADGGWLVAINNALFVSGADYLHTLETLCAGGYMSIEMLLPIPDNCIGYPQTIQRQLPADPAPFNHATKIAVLKVRRK
jgi:23S rRNA (cytosine1962-C5)-methyltransferase